jgi:uncharacterized membrane protein YbjE (DUF340 family)
MKPDVRSLVTVILTVTVAIVLLLLVGAGSFAVVEATLDWRETHIQGSGSNITATLAALIGSLVSAVIAGVVGFITGSRAKKKNGGQETTVEVPQEYNPTDSAPPPYRPPADPGGA